MDQETIGNFIHVQVKNRDEERAQFQQNLQKEVEEFIPRLKQTVEADVTERLEQEWTARVAVLHGEIKSLKTRIASSQDQLS